MQFNQVKKKRKGIVAIEIFTIIRHCSRVTQYLHLTDENIVYRRDKLINSRRFTGWKTIAWRTQRNDDSQQSISSTYVRMYVHTYVSAVRRSSRSGDDIYRPEADEVGRDRRVIIPHYLDRLINGRSALDNVRHWYATPTHLMCVRT